MTTINTIDDLVRILREQPAWAEAVRAVLLTDDLLDLPARFERFVQSQEETNRRLSELLAQLKEAHDDTRERLIRHEDRFERFVQSQEETNRRLTQLLAQLKEAHDDTRERLIRHEDRFERFVQSQEETNRRLSELLAQLKEAHDDTRERLIRHEDRFERFVQSQEETNRRLSELLAQLKEAHDDTRERLIRHEDRFERFVQSQEETNRRLSETQTQQAQLLAELKEISEDTRQRLTTLEARFDRMEGRFSNFEGEQYERMVRAKALARSQLTLGLDSVYYALTQDGIADSRLLSAVGRALREDRVSTADTGDLYETDLIISGGDNRHAVFEISLTADDYDIRRARERAGILQTITGGSVSPAVITARIDDPRYDQAIAEGVTVFVIPYP